MFDLSPRAHLASLQTLAFTFLIILCAKPAPAKATRPIVGEPSSLKDIKLAIPVDLNSILQKKLTGLDLESASDRDEIMRQARTYIQLRSGKMSKAQAAKWLADCQAQPEKPETTKKKGRQVQAKVNPYCQYEVARGRSFGSSTRPSRANRASVQTLVQSLTAGEFEAAENYTTSEIVAATNTLDSRDRFDQVAKQVSERRRCAPSQLTYAFGFKLEERFPASESVELAKRLYKKSSSCGQNLAAAQASFRLGLIHIWHGQCGEISSLMQKVEGVPEASAFHPRAKFWRYHCAASKSEKAARQEIKETLLRDYPMSFHTLALSGQDESLLTPLLQREDPQVAMRSIVRADLNPLLRGSEALARVGSPHLAAEMLDRNVSEIASMEPGVRIYTAAFLNQIGHALPSFKILGRLFQDVPTTVTGTTLKLFFPLWYLDEVKAKNSDIDPLLILSLIRQESAFNKQARSHVGARGLMQVMPGTARTVASVSARQLFNPSVNIKVGSKYFTKRLRQYQGDVEFSLAAYNAGFMRVDQWKKRYPTDNKLLFIDFIPFRETRDYVGFILRNYFWYVSLYEAPHPDTEAIASTDSRETRQMSSPGTKVLSIVSANAGHAAASHLMPEEQEK